METHDLDDRALAEAVLTSMAMALLSDDPALRQIVVPAHAEEKARSEVGELTEGLLVLDEEAIVVGIDALAARIFDVSEGDALGMPASALFTASDGPAIVASRAPDGGPPSLRIAPDILGCRRSGATLPLALRLSRVNVDGRPRFLLSVLDLVEKRRTEEPARRTEARYRALIEQIPAVTFMAALDEGRNDMYVSPQIESLLGFSQKEWLDDPVLWFKRLHPDDQALWNQEFSRGIASGGPFHAECRVIARDGRVVWILGEARLVRDELGRPLFLQGIAFDITETKRAEQQVRDAQDARIRNERLAAVGRLAASIGHDIRNPLGAISNAYYYISRRVGRTELAGDAKVQQFLGIIDKEVRACMRIVSDLLDYARERAPELVACPLGPLVNDAIALVPPLAHVSIVNDVPATLPVPDLDQDQFRQVLMNLVQNATEAIPAERGGVVRVSAASTEDEIALSVSDDGSGIPEENMDKIFEPLFTSKVKGTGLGLSIVSNTITRHGGTIQVQTRKGAGTTFTIHLPRPRG
jgi:PAS domain S-box-containing protein